MRVVRVMFLALCCVALTVVVPAFAHAAPSYPGDLEPTFVGWFDASGKPVDTVAPGQQIVAHFTVTNSLSYPIRINGIDSQLTDGGCLRDTARTSRATDAGGAFPVYLAPGQTSAELRDVAYELSASSTCSGPLPTWLGNVIGEQGTPPAGATPSKSVATVQVTQTRTETEPRKPDPAPVFILGGIALVVVTAGIVLASRGRRG